MTISVITPTFHREDLLRRCVESVLGQRVDATIEQIVVNDAGECLRPEPWMRDPRVTIFNTRQTERCVARNTGAALSHGAWLYFLDDDDYLLPGALAALLDVARGGACSVVYGSYRIDSVLKGTSCVIYPLLPADALPMFAAGEGLPLQASLYRRDAFFAVGGFDPLLVSGQDSDLVRKVARRGDFGGTRAVLSVVRTDHPATSLTDWAGHQRRWYIGLERCLGETGTASRIARGTARLPYWRGRCAREYTASAWRNLRIGRMTTAAVRLGVAYRLLLRRPASVQLWRGFARRPVPEYNGLDARLIEVAG